MSYYFKKTDFTFCIVLFKIIDTKRKRLYTPDTRKYAKPAITVSAMRSHNVSMMPPAGHN